ncbi:MAG: cysteine desulfurase family protein [Cyanobacteriota bacterium]|nr:cysteine desulfurase family protein [Cyanobacteriota bacterium]
MTKLPPIYLDCNSTTRLDPRVANRMFYYMTTAFGNASSIDHIFGDEAERAVEEAANKIAELIGCSSKEVIFTSGATESINLAIQGGILTAKNKPKIAVSPVEHKAVLDCCETLAKRGLIEVVKLKVDRLGRLDLEYLERVCASGLSLLCVMAANNEIGNIYPIDIVGKIAAKYDIPFLCDGSQAVGKVPMDFAEWGITFLAISAHKLYGPKGVGALVVRRGYRLQPTIFGGGHQKGRRSGTLNVPGIVGLGEACGWRSLEMVEDERAIAIRRDRLQTLLQQYIPGSIVNGDTTNREYLRSASYAGNTGKWENLRSARYAGNTGNRQDACSTRLSGNLHVSIIGIPNSAVIARVRDRLAISTGAACSSGVESPSHVLQALGLSQEATDGALRMGIGKFTTDEEIERAAEILIATVRDIRQAMDGN